jgi:hypothetical protein
MGLAAAAVGLEMRVFLAEGNGAIGRLLPLSVERRDETVAVLESDRPLK